MTKVIETEVIVIGGGAAAARAAIEAYQTGAKCTLVVKGRFGFRGLRGNGSTGYACTNLIYFPTLGRVVKPEEEREIIYKRIIQAGLGLADRRLTGILVDEALEERRRLERWGIIQQVVGTLDGRTTVQATRDWPGIQQTGISRHIDPMPGLANVIRSITDVTILDLTMVTDLLLQDGRCVGAIAISEVDGEPILLRANSIILGTGGEAQLFKANMHPSCVTGDGYAMGYNAGAELINMEFMQIFVSTAYPTVNSIVTSLWKENPVIRNVDGKEFLQNYLPEGVTLKECMEDKRQHGPFSTIDLGKYIDIAIMKEAKAGHVNEHGAFYLQSDSLRRASPQFMRRDEWYDYRGIDLSQRNIEITLAFQCSNGGLRVDENGQTTIPGLYAVGETAAGPHGADRLAGGMMAFCHVFGRRAGKHAAETAKAQGVPSLNNKTVKNHLKQIAELQKSKGDQKPVELIDKLKKTAWENLLAVRDKNGLTKLLQRIKEIRSDIGPRLSIESTRELVQALELRNLLQVGEIVASAALLRTESRGPHYRDDFPKRDDTNWARSVTVKKESKEMRLSTFKRDEKWQDHPEDLGEGLWG